VSVDRVDPTYIHTTMVVSQRIREASHAGSWYTRDKAQLTTMLEQWTAQTTPAPSRFAIGPHAGYRFCGPVLAHSYASVAEYSRSIAPIKRVVLMGPTHFKYFRGIQTTKYDAFTTPVGRSTIDPLAKQLVSELQVNTLDSSADLREHSWEMHCPFIAHYLPDAQLLPLLFGGGSETETIVSSFLADYVADPHTAFVVSSDFCHWGESFDYVPFATAAPLIFKHIEQMDRDACEILGTGSSQKFWKYMEQTENTICGAKPIEWLLRLAERANVQLSFQLLAYDQSSRARTVADTSVSYASLAAH